MKVYLTEYFGDIGDYATRCHPTMEAALTEIYGTFGQPMLNADKEWVLNTPDPEDDRIVIWEATPGEVVKCVWHFSGWHWDGEAGDLPGGPLEQGALPGFDKSLYELCFEDKR